MVRGHEGDQTTKSKGEGVVSMGCVFVQCGKGRVVLRASGLSTVREYEIAKVEMQVFLRGVSPSFRPCVCEYTLSTIVEGKY